MKKLLLFILLSSPLWLCAQWNLVWSDEFSGTGLPETTKWDYEVGMVRNHEAQYYTKARIENARQENGYMVIESRKEVFQTAQYTSASVITKGKAEWLYGRFEIRGQLPPGQGMWPAIWLLPKTSPYGGWPACGEVDIMENFYPRGSNKIFSTVHTDAYNWKTGTSKGNNITVADPHTHFYTYTLEWYPTRMDFYLDSTYIYSFFKESNDYKVWPFTVPFYLIINSAMGGDAGGTIDNAIFPTKFLIDYVRVYQLPNITNDITAPSKPLNLNFTVLANTLTLNWNKSSDDVGGILYEVYKNDVKIGNTIKPTYNINIALDTTYSFKIKTIDGSANGTSSDTVQYKGIIDVVPPTMPTAFQATSATYTSLLLLWGKSTDNVALNGYDIYKDGVLLASAPPNYTSFAVNDLVPNTAYTFKIVAKDRKGNLSTPATASAQTRAMPNGLSNDIITLKIYPNPFCDKLMFETQGVIDEITISSLQGIAMIKHSCKGQLDVTMDASSLPEAIYLVSVLYTGGSMETRKLCKIKQ